MIILDTNLVSEMMKERDERDAAVVAWMRRQPRTRVYVTAVTVFELRHGLDLMSTGARSAALRAAFEDFVKVGVKGRVLPFDEEAAHKAAALMANRAQAGKTMDAPDGWIAGIALARKATLATRNVKDFEGTNIDLINPWTD